MKKFAIAALMMSVLAGCGTAPVAAPVTAKSNTATASSISSGLIVTSAIGDAGNGGIAEIKGYNAKGDFHLVLVMKHNPSRYVPDLVSATLNGKAVTSKAQLKVLSEELSAAKVTSADRVIAWQISMAEFALRNKATR